MHLPDGVVSGPICLTALAGTVVATGLALRRVPDREIPRMAVLAALFFAAGSVHLRVGIVSVHLQLTGLLAVMLGGVATAAVAYFHRTRLEDDPPCIATI